MENYHYYPSNYCNYCEDVMSNVSSDEHENEKNEESPERIEESPERIEESPERIEKSPERIEESPDFQLVRDSSIDNGFPPEKDNNSTKMDTENSPPSVSQPVIPRFKFKKTAGKVTSSEDTSDTSKSSKEKCSDSFKSAEGGFECPKHILESSSEERVTKQNDEEKSSDDSQSNRFIPPKLKSCSAKGQLISKANFKFFIWTKNQWKYFCISALASKHPSKVVKTKDKGTKRLIYHILFILYFLDLTTFRG